MRQEFYLSAMDFPSESEIIMRRTFAQCLAARGCALGEEGYGIRVCRVPGDADGYRIEQTADGVLLTGCGIQNLFAALGRFLFESEFDGNGGFSPPILPIVHQETIAVRGMYYATHFHNFYQEAPLTELFDQVTDLALRDANALLVWFDMHTYHGMTDPAAVTMTARLKALLKHAEAVGIKPSMLMLANEGFAGTPEAIQAENAIQNGYTATPLGFYHTEICPSKPGGRDELLRQRREMLEAFRGIDLQYVCYWPYDQGGCTCQGCAPWGTNGYLRLFPDFRRTVQNVFPDAKILLSTWFFDRFTTGEWEGMTAFLKNGLPEGVSHVLSFFFGDLPEPLRRDGMPKDVPFISFPEISMQGAEPWGGFGANPLPRFLDEGENDGLYQGGFPYSEGIFEDLNKWICLSRFAGVASDATDAVRRYLKWEFCSQREDLLQAILKMEETLPRYVHTEEDGLHCELHGIEAVESVAQTISACEKQIPEALRQGFKWRILAIRAALDRELLACGGIPSRSAQCQVLLQELYDRYHAEQALSYVRPPVGL